MPVAIAALPLRVGLALASQPAILPAAPRRGSADAHKHFHGYSTATEDYSEAGTIDTSVVFEQTFTTYDEASNAIQTDHYERFHDDPTTGTGSQGTLNGPSASDPKARASYTAMYSDGIGRTVNLANYGTNDNSSFTRSAAAPARSDAILITTTDFNARGEAWQTTDSAATVTQQTLDDAGRRKKLVENYVSGGTADDQNRTTEWTHNADSRVATMKVKNSMTGDQTSSFSYGVTVSGGSEFNSNDPLHVETYPDAGTIIHEHNRQLQNTKLTDQNGTVHTLVYDKLGRRSDDQVTTLPSSIHGTVRRIKVTYEVRGNVQNATQYDAPTSGNVVNDVRREYNNFQQPITEYQEHGGAVNTSTSPKVQYAYADGSVNTIRRTEMSYPDIGSGNRKITFGYGSSGSVADKLSRIADLSFRGTSQIAGYTYLGRETFVRVEYTEPAVHWDLITGSGADPYAGLDRFGRVIDSLWFKYSSPTADLDRIKHGYDRASNRLWRENTVSKSLGTPKYFDELYACDGFYQLTNQKRGQLSGSPPSSITNLQFEQQWGLDATGNWKAFKEDSNGDGIWDLNQTRAANPVNEITAITNSAGPTWIQPAYDSAGNITTVPQPTAPDNQFIATYDAWNRRVTLSDGTNIVQENTYDGLMRRTIKKTYAGGTLAETRHYYFSLFWQILEERLGTSTIADRQFVPGLRYVDDLVCRDDTVGRLYCLADPHWNATALLDTSGNVLERYCYSAFGTTTVLTAGFSVRTTSAYDWQQLYSGYRVDPDTGIMDVRFRQYNSALGTWHTRDPLRHMAGINLYGYCRGRVVIAVDPLGLAPQDHHWFPQMGVKGQPMVNAICCGEHQIDIDDFTTTLANSSKGTPHEWLHHTFHYNDLAQAIYAQYKGTKNCCGFLLEMAALMQSAWFALEKQFPDQITTATPNLHHFHQPGQARNSAEWHLNFHNP